MRKVIYIVLLVSLLSFISGCAGSTWTYQGSIVKEVRDGQVCYKVYNSNYELLENSCDNEWRE